MFNIERDKDTICAVATPPGLGGVSVIRVSGEDSIDITSKLCGFLPSKPESHRVYYGFLKDLVGSTPIDEVLVSFFMKGKSFTGEHTMEISSHGSPVITQNILQELVSAGARLAQPGEFTYRAFMSGRIDLVQAESILTLIESESKKSARLSLRQLKGELSNKLIEIEDQLTLTLAHLEANIDFASEDIEVEANSSLQTKVASALQKIEALLSTYSDGRAIQQGLKVALLGEPNVGKSSLLNALSGEEKAIVTHIAGTTRDFVEGKLSINGQLVHLVDTAGLRATEDEVEAIGIKRTLALAEEVDEVFLLIDLSKPIDGQLTFDMNINADTPLSIIGNKLDIEQPDYSRYSLLEMAKESLENSGENPKLLKILDKTNDSRVFKVSAQAGQGIQSIHDYLKERTAKEFSESSAMISQARHFELLTRVKESLLRTLEQFKLEDSPEFIAFELQESLKSLHEVLGKQFDDEVMDRVFKEFCLGK